MVADYVDARHFKYGQVWYWGQVPSRSDMLAFMDPISTAFRRMQQVYISATGRPMVRPTFTQGGSFTVTVASNAGVTPDGYGVQWPVAGLAFDGSASTHGSFIGSTAPVTPSTKRYVILAVAHVFEETTPVVDKGGNTVNRIIDSKNEARVYQLNADVADADDWRVNAALQTQLDAVITDDAIPLLICERRQGLSDFQAADIHPYERVIAEAGSLADEVEAIRGIHAFSLVGKVMTSDGLVAATPNAVGGTPGSVTFSGGEELVLATVEKGTDGRYGKIVVRRVALPAATLALDTINTRYVIRAKLDNDGGITLYKGTTPTATTYPDLSQTPGPFGTGTSGGTNQAFWTTAADIALCEALSGNNGDVPVLTFIDNHSLSHLYYLLANTVFSNTIATLESLALTDALDVTGDAIFRSTLYVDTITTLLAGAVTLDDAVTVAGILTAQDDLIVTNDGEFGGNLQVDGNLTVDGTATITGGLVFGSDLDVTGDITNTGDLGVGESPGPPSANFAVTKTTEVTEQMWSNRVDPEATGYYWEKIIKGIVGPSPNTQGPVGYLRASCSSPGHLRWDLYTSRQLSAPQLALRLNDSGQLESHFGQATTGIQEVANFTHDVSNVGKTVGDGSGIALKIKGTNQIPYVIGRWRGSVKADGVSTEVDLQVVDNGGANSTAMTLDYFQKVITPPVAWAWASVENTGAGTYAIRDSGDGQHNVSAVAGVVPGQLTLNLATAVPDIDRAIVNIQIRGASNDMTVVYSWNSTVQLLIDLRQITAIAGPAISMVGADSDIDVTVYAAP